MPVERQIAAYQQGVGISELEEALSATGVPLNRRTLLRRLSELGIGFKDLNTRQSSLEDIFVSLVSQRGAEAR